MNLLNQRLKSLPSVIIILMVISTVIVFSTSTVLAYKNGIADPFFHIKKHVTFLMASGLLIYIMQKGSVFIYVLKGFRNNASVILILCACLVWYTLFGGQTINGATRWLSIGPISFQPSEIAKFGLMIYLAKVLSRGIEDKMSAEECTLWSACGTAVIILPILPHNLSTTLLIIAAAMFMYLISGVFSKLALKNKILFPLVGTLIVVGGLSIAIASGKMGRMKTWQGRIERIFSDDPDDREKNMQQGWAKDAIAFGGILGTGPGNSYMKNILPEAHCDFIFSIILEEYGILGGVAVVVLYIWLLTISYRISQQSNSIFVTMLNWGITLIIVLQAAINICVGSGMFVTGQTLPLISQGGTSTLIMGFAFGILMCVRKYVNLSNKNQQNKSNVSATADTDTTTDE